MRGVLAQGYRVTFPAGNGAGSVCTGWEMLLQAVSWRRGGFSPGYVSGKEGGTVELSLDPTLE